MVLEVKTVDIDIINQFETVYGVELVNYLDMRRLRQKQIVDTEDSQSAVKAERHKMRKKKTLKKGKEEESSILREVIAIYKSA